MKMSEFYDRYFLQKQDEKAASSRSIEGFELLFMEKRSTGGFIKTFSKWYNLAENRSVYDQSYSRQFSDPKTGFLKYLGYNKHCSSC